MHEGAAVKKSEHNQRQPAPAADAAHRTLFRAEAMQRHLERRSITVMPRIRGSEVRPAIWMRADGWANWPLIHRGARSMSADTTIAIRPAAGASPL